MYNFNLTICPAGHEYHNQQFAECPQCTLIDVNSPTGEPLFTLCEACGLLYNPIYQDDECPRCGTDYSYDEECRACSEPDDLSHSDYGLCAQCEGRLTRAEDRE